MAKQKAKSSNKKARPAESYKHPEAQSLIRPEIGTQAQFKKKKPPKTYRYDSSLSPALDWDGQNPAREQDEQLIRRILESEKLEEAKEAAAKLKALSKPFLNWAGKAERLSFDVPTLPLFIHERLSTKAIIETLAGHKKDQQQSMFELFGDPERSITDQVLKAYEYPDQWTNRMILGDSLVVMSSLLHYEGLGGQVQMIYMDPPYGVKFGSNFQPFVRKRDVGHGDDEDMTREPETVQAYRDTWELGLHSYLTYLRDRLLLARDLLTPSGSIFVQISDENLHHVREVMDEVFGPENFCRQISFVKTSSATSELLPVTHDFLLWFAKDRSRLKFRNVLKVKDYETLGSRYRYITDDKDRVIGLTDEQILGLAPIPGNQKPFWASDLTSQHPSDTRTVEYRFRDQIFHPGHDRQWSVSKEALDYLVSIGRLAIWGKKLIFKRYVDDFPYEQVVEVWEDTTVFRYTDSVRYVVQTTPKVIQRCLLMTTDPGDLVLDPTCGSGTTAYVAEQWGRRWITIDTSHVPLALARQRLLTATFPWYELKDDARGPAGGFVYKRKQNKKGEEIGGIVPHITLKSIANNEPPQEEVLVDRPEEKSGITRVAGPFCVEATIPTPVDWEESASPGPATTKEKGASQDYGSFVDRMLEVLRKSPVLRLDKNKTVTFKNIRPPAKSLSLSAEALITNGLEKPVAFVFGPEHGAVSNKLVESAAREANGKNYSHLYVIGFAIEAKARETVEHCEDVFGIPAAYVQATPDLMMGDLLKNMRSSQIFSVCGLPDVKIHRTKDKQYQVELLGLDVFDPVTMQAEHRSGDDVPAWFLDTDYNDLCFHVSQAFFPRTGAWDNLKKALKGEYDESLWAHLAGTLSAPFPAGEHRQIAVKVIDDRGNELLVVKPLSA